MMTELRNPDTGELLETTESQVVGPTGMPHRVIRVYPKRGATPFPAVIGDGFVLVSHANDHEVITQRMIDDHWAAHLAGACPCQKKS